MPSSSASATENPSPTHCRSRSLGGCTTCRTRHVKCDEQRPACSTCQRFGLSCGGYEIRISFDRTDNYTGNAFRRPIFTESERESMSNLLVASVKSSTAQRILSQLEEKCEQAGGSGTAQSLDIQNGPFGVFGIHQPAEPESVISLDRESPTVLEEDSFEEVLDQPPANGDVLFDPNSWDLNNDLNEASLDPLDSLLEPLPESDFQGDASLTDIVDDSFALDVAEQIRASANHSLFPHIAPSLPGLYDSLPEDAPLLLSTYKNCVIGALSPWKYHKSPWHILHLPSAMHTLAALTLGDAPGHANLSIFYAVLAISAYSLRGSLAGDTCRYWNGRGDHYKKEAQIHLKLTLQDAFSYPKKAKYKDVLMSLLTMVTVSIFAGNLEHSECYLLDAEKFIHLRGLTKIQKSRKVRLLHHCYSYLRIFSETTFIALGDKKQEGQLSSSTDSESLVLRKPCPFRLGQYEQDLEKKLLEVKSRPQGENDLHLKMPGRWDFTLYPDIFGIPESFLVLLSQTIRLGNEKDIAESAPEEKSLSWQEFSSRAKILERCISKWERSEQPYPDCKDESVDRGFIESNRRMIDNMLQALHSALSIYFYRRIYDVDATILQQKVEQARDCLLKCQEENGGKFICSAGFLWPAFIAACEALSYELQEFFSTWFATCAKNSGLRIFLMAQEIAEDVWTKRRPSNETTISWIDLVKKRNMRLFYSY